MLKNPVRVLIVDDSAYMRKVLREMLARSPLINVVGTARDGKDALDQVKELQPDVVTVDLYMPGEDGVGFIRAQMAHNPLPIVVCSSISEGSELFIAALEAGAVEFVPKPTALALEKMFVIETELVEAVIAAASIPAEKLKISPSVDDLNNPLVFDNGNMTSRVAAVVIGVSTGGPRALREILPRLPANLPVPIIIALHMPDGYTRPMAEKLSDICSLEVQESENGMIMKPGRVILAQAGVNTRLVRMPDGSVVTKLDEKPPDSLYCPSVDELFKSAADVYGGRVLGVVMTGMGNDGTAGAAWIKAQGGFIFAESEKTSVVYGMPRSVVEAGLVDKIVSLDMIPESIMEVLA
jgi:two-component system chemotaxis response regulator CheB